MKTEILERIFRIISATTLGIVLFPYLNDFVIDYFGELSIFFAFASLILCAFMILLFTIVHKLTFYKKLNKNGYFWKCTYQLLIIAMYTLFGVYLLTEIHAFWVCIVLIGIEAFQFVEGIFERRNALHETEA
jgi:MFS family permease